MCQGKVASCQVLVRNLLAALRISSTMTCVNYLVAKVFVIFIASGENDRIRAFFFATGDAGDQRPMYPGC